jgi:hypothetical protein
MAGKLLIPIDGYIEAQEFWHKMKKARCEEGEEEGCPSSPVGRRVQGQPDQRSRICLRGGASWSAGR